MCGCLITFDLPASLSASGFQGAGRQAGRQNPRFSQSLCATHLSLSLSLRPRPRHMHSRLSALPQSSSSASHVSGDRARGQRGCATFSSLFLHRSASLFLGPCLCAQASLPNRKQKRKKTRGSARTRSGRTWRALVPQCCPSRLSWTPKSHWEGIWHTWRFNGSDTHPEWAIICSTVTISSSSSSSSIWRHCRWFCLTCCKSERLRNTSCNLGCIIPETPYGSATSPWCSCSSRWLGRCSCLRSLPSGSSGLGWGFRCRLSLKSSYISLCISLLRITWTIGFIVGCIRVGCTRISTVCITSSCPRWASRLPMHIGQRSSCWECRRSWGQRWCRGISSHSGSGSHCGSWKPSIPTAGTISPGIPQSSSPSTEVRSITTTIIL